MLPYFFRRFDGTLQRRLLMEPLTVVWTYILLFCSLMDESKFGGCLGNATSQYL